jgi:dolichol-phosphate mannosyltransferase
VSKRVMWIRGSANAIIALMKHIVVIPTYNERDTIGEMIGRIRALHDDVVIMVVDDNSPDGTADVVREHAKKDSLVRLVVRERKTGLGDAYKDVLSRLQEEEGIEKILTMDADGSHDPVYVKELLDALDHHDFSVGSRYVPGGNTAGWGWFRNLISRGGNTYVRMLIGSPVHDLTSGFVGFRADVLRKLEVNDIPSSGYSYQMEFKDRLVRNGHTFKEIPIVFVDREVGNSKMSGKIVLEGILTPWRILFSKLK